MENVNSKLSVFFDDPFWIGVFERVEEGKMTVCKVTFGSEPKDYEVWEYVLLHYGKLRFSPAVEVEVKQKADNPKRRQRNARKQLLDKGIGTKSQQALSLQREENKIERKKKSKEEREIEKERQLMLKQMKRKQKHKGH